MNTLSPKSTLVLHIIYKDYEMRKKRSFDKDYAQSMLSSPRKANFES